MGPPAPTPADVGLHREPADLGEEPGELRVAEFGLPGRPEEVRVGEGLPIALSPAGISEPVERGGEIAGGD